MKRINKIVLILLSIMLVGVVGGCGKKELTRGTLDGHVYTNDYFGLQITYPEAWVMGTNEEIDSLIADSNQMLSDANADAKSLLELSKLKTVYFSMGGNGDAMNIANFMSLAEKVSALQGVTSSTTYLELTKKNFETLVAQIPYTFPKEIYTETIGGKEFSVLEAQVDTGSSVITQKYYCTLMNDYALCFIATSTNEENAALAQGILDSIVLGK